MSASHSPVICATCHRPLPEGVTQDDAPRYFAQYGLLPERDDGEEWAYQANTIIGYMKAVSELAAMVRSSAEPPYDDLMSLLADLSQEAERRIALCRTALENVWKREEAAKKAHTHTERGA
jgi:hypothetical protein